MGMFSSTKVSILMLLSSPALVVQATKCNGFRYAKNGTTKSACKAQAMTPSLGSVAGEHFDPKFCKAHQDAPELDHKGNAVVARPRSRTLDQELPPNLADLASRAKKLKEQDGDAA